LSVLEATNLASDSSLGIFPLLDLGPEFLENLKGDSTAEKGVAFTQMLQGISLGLLVEVPVGPSALLELLEPTRVLDHAIERTRVETLSLRILSS
jgi:hypothetical protein